MMHLSQTFEKTMGMFYFLHKVKEAKNILKIFRMLMQGAITKRITVIEEMTWIDVLCSDKAGTLTVVKSVGMKLCNTEVNLLIPVC